MNFLKGCFLVIWSLIGLLVLASLAGSLAFVTSGGLQKLGDAVGSQIQNQVQSVGGNQATK